MAWLLPGHMTEVSLRRRLCSTRALGKVLMSTKCVILCNLMRRKTETCFKMYQHVETNSAILSTSTDASAARPDKLRGQVGGAFECAGSDHAASQFKFRVVDKFQSGEYGECDLVIFSDMLRLLTVPNGTWIITCKVQRSSMH